MPWVDPITRRAAWIIIAAAVIAFLALAKAFVLPLALSILLAFLLSPVVRWVQKRTGSHLLSVSIACLLGITVIGGIGLMAVSQAVDFAEKLPVYRHSISKKLIALKGTGDGMISRTLRTLEDIEKDVETASATQPSSSAQALSIPPIRVVNTQEVGLLESTQNLIQPLVEPVLISVIVAVLVFLLLIYGQELRDRVVVLAGTNQLTVTSQALEDASRRVGRYLLMLSLVNAFFGTAIGIGLMVIGLPNALLLGLIAGLLRFVPVLGAWLGAGLPILLAFAVMESWSSVWAVIGLFAFFEALVNFAIEPYLYGHSTGISGVGVLLAILFWTWIWGPVGLLLAVPITVCLVVFGKYLEPLRVFYILLSDEPMLSPQRRLYHRLVTGDVASAEQLYSATVKDQGILRAADDLLLPVLEMAVVDHQTGKITDERYQLLLDSIEPLVTELSQSSSPTADPTQEIKPILIVPSTPSDRAAAVVVKQVLQQELPVAVHILNSSLVTDIIHKAESESISTAVLVGVGPESTARSRLVLKSLRHRLSGLKVLLLNPEVTSSRPDTDQRILSQVKTLVEHLRPSVYTSAVSAIS